MGRGRLDSSAAASGLAARCISRDQRVALSTHVGGWKDFQLSTFLEAELGLPAVMDNDANVGALGEACFGAGRGHDPLFYMTLSTGIGGGVVERDGAVYRGADSYAGEIGHLTIRPGRSGVPLRRARLPRTDVRRALDGAGSRPHARGS